MVEPHLPRSYLFVPGNRPERFPKAFASAADAVIIDLEDAVSPDEKRIARSSVGAFLSPETPIILRINSVKTEWFTGDLELCRTDGVIGVILPKAETVHDIRAVAQHVSPSMSILPLVETARGLWNVHSLAEEPQVQRLLFGSIDLQLDLGITSDENELLYHRSRIVLASRVAGICAPIDGICTDLENTSRLRKESLRAYRMGFGGKLCVHPRQTHTVNVCFEPSRKEKEWAKRIVAVAGTARGAAVAVDGVMIDRPLLTRAEAIVLRVESPRKQ